jgi:hypothetical protein
MLVYARLGAFDSAALRNVYHYIEENTEKQKNFAKLTKNIVASRYKFFIFAPEGDDIFKCSTSTRAKVYAPRASPA